MPSELLLPFFSKRDDESPPPKEPESNDDDRSGPSKTTIALVGLATAVIVGVITWIVLRQLRARRLGLPTSFNPFPSTSSSSTSRRPGGTGGPLGWIREQFNRVRRGRHRTAGGGYEGAGGVAGGRGRRSHRGFGPLDPDEAWDSHIGNETDTYGPGGYYEEQELGLHGAGGSGGGAGPYGGSEYGGAGGSSYLGVSHELDESHHHHSITTGSRGRSRDRDSNPYNNNKTPASSSSSSPRRQRRRRPDVDDHDDDDHDRDYRHARSRNHDDDDDDDDDDNPFADDSAAESSRPGGLRHLSPAPVPDGSGGGGGGGRH